MDAFAGYAVGLFVNKAQTSLSPNMFSFSVSDNIYSAFPMLDLSCPDNAGILLELGNFTQGVLLNIKFGIAKDTANLLDIDFRSARRDAISPTSGTPGFSGNLQVKGLHDSYFKNRKAPNIALKEITVADAVKKMFSSEIKLKVENTNGKIESYSFDDPYRFTRDVLLPQAANEKVRPYVFFRDLENTLRFQSIDTLERDAPIEKLTFGEIEGENAYNTLNSFLPYNEGLDKTLTDFNVTGKTLKNDLTFEVANKTIAADAKDKIPVVIDTRIHHARYFHRQFNPKVEYGQLNNAFYADAMRAGFFVDKAFCTLPLHPNLTAGKVVEVAVSILDKENKHELSETFSGNWLIEQSIHSWAGPLKQAQTQIILCRSSMKPRRDSIIIDQSFRD